MNTEIINLTLVKLFFLRNHCIDLEQFFISFNAEKSIF